MNKLNDTFQFDSLVSKDFTDFSYGWNLDASHTAAYFLGLSENNIFYSVKVNTAPDFDQSRKAGDFVAGLWKRDVAELFIGDKVRQCYQEFNFAPSGALWTGFFSGYRQENARELKQLPDPDIKITKTENCWQVSVTLPLKHLSFPVNPSDLICCATAISGQNPRHFFTSMDIKSAQPDFHAFLR